MDVVKKNLLSIIFGVIALLAVAALFYPIGGMYDDMQKTLTAEGSSYSEVTGLLNRKRQLPVMPALGDSGNTVKFLEDSQQRPVFPNAAVIAKGTEAVAQVHDQSLALVKAADDCNVHLQLVPGVLPNVTSSSGFDFKNAYQQQFDPKNPNSIPALLQATAPPTADEVKVAADAMWLKDYKPQIYTINNAEANRTEVETEFKVAAANLPIELRNDRATKFKMYLVLPEALSIHPAMNRTEAPSPEEVWFAQLSLWVEQDVAHAIAQSNSDSVSVLHSAVKQLVKLEIPQDGAAYVTEQDLKNGSSGAPKPEGSALPSIGFMISPTGRVCNSLYDVVHFTLILNVDATRLPQVLADLERNKLITVLQVDAMSVDSSAALNDGFVFGKDPVIKVTLKCEALFLLSWLDSPPPGARLMPDSVRRMLHGGESNTPGGPGGGPGMGPGMGPGGGMGPNGFGSRHRPNE